MADLLSPADFIGGAKPGSYGVVDASTFMGTPADAGPEDSPAPFAPRPVGVSPQSPGVHRPDMPQIGLTLRSLQGDVDSLLAGNADAVARQAAFKANIPATLQKDIDSLLANGVPESDPEIVAKRAALAAQANAPSSPPNTTGWPDNDPEIQAKRAIIANPNAVANPTRDMEAGAGSLLRGFQDIPDGVLRYLTQKFGSPTTAQNLDARLAAEKIEYEAKRQALGGGNADVPDPLRIAGNTAATGMVIPPLGTAWAAARAAMKLPGGGGSLVGAGVRGAGAGGTGAAVQPVYNTQDLRDAQGNLIGGEVNPNFNYDAEKTAQIAAGIKGGAALGLVGRAAGNVIGPNTKPAVTAMRQEGVPLTIGQTLGGRWNSLEQALESAPISGGAISEARAAGYEAFNRQAVNKTLGNIGEKLSESTPTGPAAITELGQKTKAAYDDLMPKLSATIDPPFFGRLSLDVAKIKDLTKERQEQIASIIQDKIASKIDPATGTIRGDRLKDALSDLRELSTNYQQTGDADQRLMGRILGNVRDTLYDLVKRNNPGAAIRLTNIDTAYAMQKRIEDAASKAGTAMRGGLFTPAQLDQAVRSGATDRSYARGDALLQDYARAGQQTMGSTLPDSGTATRMNALNPAHWIDFLVGAGPSSMLYSPLGGKIATGILAERPELAGALGEATRRGGLLAAPSASQNPLVMGLLGGR